MVQKLFKNLLLFLQLVRYQNLVITALTLGLANYFLLGQVFWEAKLLLLVLSTVLIAAGGYLINDFYDITIDLKNKPHKVLIGKFFTKKSVLFFYFLFNLLALILGFLISVQVGLVDLSCALSLWLYAFYLKKTPLWGNVLVALLSALVLLMLPLMYQQTNEGIYLLAIFAFFISLIREIVKDMEDIEGDKMGNCQTLPIIFGILKSKYLIYSILVAFIFFLESYFFVFKNLKTNYLTILIYQILIPVLLLFWFYRLYFAIHKKDFHYLSGFCKVLMLIGILGMVFF